MVVLQTEHEQAEPERPDADFEDRGRQGKNAVSEQGLAVAERQEKENEKEQPERPEAGFESGLKEEPTGAGKIKVKMDSMTSLTRTRDVQNKE